jgi:HAE1 family hydrophobic/amphiphilic exporter-1
MGDTMGEVMRPFWEADSGSDEAAALPDVPLALGTGEDAKQVMVKAPPVQNFFYAVFNGAAIMGCFSKEEGRVNPLIPVLMQAGGQFPGCFSMFWQVPLFGRAFGSGNSVELELRCDNEELLNRCAGMLFGQLLPVYGYPQPEPQSFNVGRPEVQAVVDRIKAADLGLSVADIGFTVAAAINGAYVGSYIDDGDEIDLVIKVEGLDRAAQNQVAQLPLRTPGGQIIPLNAVAELKPSFEPQSIRHSESARSIKFTVSLPPDKALEEGIADIQENIIAPIRASGVMTDDVIVTLEGNADKLVQTQRALIGSFTGLLNQPRLPGISPLVFIAGLLIAVLLLGVSGFIFGQPRIGALIWLVGGALVVLVVMGFNPQLAVELLQSRAVLALLVTYLLMAALFESFIYPIVIMLAVPLALVGGFAGLALTHFFTLRNPVTPIQQLDVLTMLGFIILVGIVVNNAILIVHQALNNMRERDMAYNDAIATSVRTRVRPIFMTALTSIGGMLPLVIMPGSGSELYRGLGSVMVGGLLVSTVFTLLLIPAMFSLFVQFRAYVTGSALARDPSSSGGRHRPGRPGARRGMNREPARSPQDQVSRHERVGPPTGNAARGASRNATNRERDERRTRRSANGERDERGYGRLDAGGRNAV